MRSILAPPSPLHLCVPLLFLLSLFAHEATAQPRSRGTALEDAFASGDLDAFDPLPYGAVRSHVSTWTRPGSYLTLGGVLRTGERGEDMGVFAVLGLPLDALAPPRPAPPRPERALYTDESASANVAVADTPRATVTTALARATVLAAWRSAGVPADGSRLESMVSRARTSGLLPEARLRVTRYFDERASVDSLPEQSRLIDSSSRNVGLEARLTFRFDRLLFADEEPHIERIRLDQEALRSKIAGRVLDLLFQWQRVTLDAKAAGEARALALRASELEAMLDVLTAGWFSAHAPRQR